MSAKKVTSTKKKSLTSYPTKRKKTPVKKTKRKTTASKKPKTVYTYILKDIKLDIFKIGKTTSPPSRFKNLCKRGVVVPLALADEDVEEKLHGMFAENRVEHPGYINNGATEWFKRGGKFDEFLTRFDENEFLPYITPHEFVVDFIARGLMILDSVNTSWELEQNVFAHYFLGLEILRALGYIDKHKNGTITTNDPGVSKFGAKLLVSEKVLSKIEEGRTFYVSAERYSPLITKNADKKYGSRLREVKMKDSSAESALYLLINKKACKINKA